MAHPRLTGGPAARATLALLASVALGGCGGPPPEPPRAPGGAPFAEEDARYGSFHSKRFRFTLSLPDGKAWRIDDRSRPWLVAEHEPTATALHAGLEDLPRLTSRAVCLERARAQGTVPPDLVVVEEERASAPAEWDGAVLVGVRPHAGPAGAHEGHVLLAAGRLRSCLFVHARTTARDEAVLSDRLAVLRARTLDRVRFDDTRTAADAKAPEGVRVPRPHGAGP